MKVKKKAKHGGARVGSGPRVLPEDKKMQVSLYVKYKLADNPEKFNKLKNAVYEFIENVYEINLNKS